MENVSSNSPAVGCDAIIVRRVLMVTLKFLYQALTIKLPAIAYGFLPDGSTSTEYGLMPVSTFLPN